MTPGVSAGTEGISGLYVRGGNSDENLFLVDGNPVYQVNHIGGFFSAFNNEAIKGMNFFKAGFPARYGGRLSSVVDVHTKEGNMKEFHGSASLGLVSGNLNLEGPIWKDRTSFNIALRRTWLDVLTAPVLAIVNKKNKKNGERINVRYAFHDLNARIDHRFSDRSRMYLSLYNGNDVLKVGSEDFAYSEYTSEYRNTIDAYMRWGNLVASAGWTYAFSNKLFGKLSGFYTRYRSKIRYKEEDVSGKEGDSGYKYSLDETTNVTGITDFGVRTSFDYRPVAAHRIRFGGDYLIHYFQPEYNRMKALDNSLPDSMQIAKTFSDDKLWAHELAAYAEDDWSISDAFRLNVGLRFSLFNIDNRTYTGIEPRVSMRWLLSPDVSLKASYSRMNQYVHLISNSFMDLPTDSWMPVTNKLKPLVSDQISLGGYYNWNQLLDFSVEGYYKRMNNLLEYKDGYSLIPSSVSWENKMASGEGRAYGVEFMVRKQTGKTTGWVGYALAWADRQFDEINKGRRYPSRYDNRHKLNIVVMHKLSKKVELSAAWTYSSGNYTTLSLENYYPSDHLHQPGERPFWGNGTGEDYYDQRNNYQLPAYHRLDVGINIYRPKKKGRMGIWNISIYNVYSRMNPILVYKGDVKEEAGSDDYGNPNVTYRNAFKSIGIFPIIPSVSYTYKFRRRKKMRYNICILVLLLFVLSGCEKEINLEHMRPEPKLVLNCLAVQGDTLSVELSRTWFYADNKVKDIFVSGADVKLYVNDVFRESLSEVAVKYEELDIDAVRYKSSSYIPVTGDRIRLVASRNGFKDVEAVTEVPRPCSVSGFELQQESVRDTTEWFDDAYIHLAQNNTVCFTLHDEPGEDNYYLIYFRQGNIWGGENDTVYSWYSFRPDYGSEPVFAVQNSALDQIFGYDGVGGYNGLAFSDELFDGKSYQFKIPWKISLSYTQSVDYTPYIYRCYLYSVSRSYYNYMKTMNDLYESGFVGDLAEIGFAEPVRIYSNVEGGTGILGGSCMESWEFTSE